MATADNTKAVNLVGVHAQTLESITSPFVVIRACSRNAS